MQSLVESAVTKLELVLHTAAATPDEGSPGSPGGERPGMSAHELYGLCHGACQMVQHATLPPLLFSPPSPPHTFFYSPFRASSRAFQTSSPCATRCVVCPTWHTGCPCLSGAAWRLQPDGVPDARRQGPQSRRSHCHDTLTSHPQTLPHSPSHSPTHMQPDGVPDARRQAEAAFYDPKMLALLYFPEDEKYGIPSTLFWTVF